MPCMLRRGRFLLCSMLAPFALALAGCGDDGSGDGSPVVGAKPSDVARPVLGATPTVGPNVPTPGKPAKGVVDGWATFTNPVPEASEPARARHIGFSFRHPPSWKEDPNAVKKDETSFVRLNGRSGAVSFQVRVNRAQGVSDPVAEVADGVLENIRKALGDGKDFEVVSKASVTVDGVEGRDVVYRHSMPASGTQHWLRLVFLPVRDTEWGMLSIQLQVAGTAPKEDPTYVTAQGDLQSLLDSFTIAR